MQTLARLTLISIAALGATSAHTEPDATAEAPTTELLLASAIQWEKLNPARGDKSPQAGTLWGNRKASTPKDDTSHTECPICNAGAGKGGEPTGFLAKFVDGFSSPPHIHNVTYRAVVISGAIHNDDPDAAPMWMSPGSFWTQPKGEVHITAAKGDDVMALVEIDQGPYLVLPPEEAFDSGEKPINADASNLVWIDPPGMTASGDGPKIAYLWGNLEDGESNGTFLKLPAGFSGSIQTEGSTFRAVVIQGQLQYHGADTQTLDPGSYFGSSGAAVHSLSCKSEVASTIYIRTNAKYEISRTQE